MGHEDHRSGDIGNDAPSWNAMYDEKPTVWSGKPNAQLVAEASPLPPGSVLDVGCGEGADAVWLAQRGWDVTAVDISSVALDRAREHAQAAGVAVNFVEVDLLSTPPDPASYDLVSAQFFQFAEPQRSQLMRGLGAAVKAGGRLLIVGHEPSPTMNPALTHRLFSADEITALFSSNDWTTEVAESRSRTAMHHGEMTDLIDVVVRLRRSD